MKTAEAQSKDEVIRPEMLSWIREEERGQYRFFLGRRDGRTGEQV